MAGNLLEKNSSLVRKRIEQHKFEDEDGEEYEASKFNGFGDYFRRKKIKLQNLDSETRAASEKPKIFKGIVAHVTGYTQPPLHVLHRNIVEYGGGFLQYLDSKTMATHIIASTLPPKKTVDFSRYRIVKPAWVMDSIEAGKLLPWSEYRVIDEGPRQKVLTFDNSKGLAQSSPVAKRGYSEQIETSFYANQLRNSTNDAGTDEWSQIANHLEESSTARQQREKLTAAEGTQSPETSWLNHRQEETPSKAPPIKTIPHLRAAEAAADESPGNRPLIKRAAQEKPISEMTSEEHNAWLLSDPKMRQVSCANPDFLQNFYSESRLHHLSTWKAELKSSMQRLAIEKGLSEKKYKARPGARKYIMHVDFDSFFCAVSLKSHPELVDKPTVVAHGSGPGSEIASCNYPAREFGVKNGMWMKRALEMCPSLKVIPYDFPAYEDASRLFYESIMEIGGVVQSVSVDEALIDATGIILTLTGSQGTEDDDASITREQMKAEEIASNLRQRIRDRTKCEVSVGMGGNILQAKVALRRAKPAGQYLMKPAEVVAILGELEVEQLPGVSRSIGGRLRELGIRLVKDIRDTSKERLVSALGPKTGEKLAEYAKGIDRTEVGTQPPRKSVSAEVSWGIRFIEQTEAEEFLMNLCKELERRLLNEQVKGRNLTLKVMRRSLDAPLDPVKHLGHGKCDTFNKSSTFGVSTYSHQTIGREAIQLLRSFKFSVGDLRGLGVQMTKLEPLKPNTAAAEESSQKKLQFAVYTAAPTSDKQKPQVKHEQIDEVESPVKKIRSSSGKLLEQDLDPITDDPMTPKKPKVHPAMALARAGLKDSKAQSPLNIGGTQFIIPSNADPAVLAELPNDIRNRLMNQGQKTLATPRAAATPYKSRSESPAIAADTLPSQVDPEVFNALPDDMKAEILATYGRKVASPAPKSPTTAVALGQAGPSTRPSPSKRGRGGRKIFGNAQRQKDSKAGVVQTNFVTANASAAETDDVSMELVEELDPEFLAELPEDVRKEVIADHRRRRLAQRSRLEAPVRKQYHNEVDNQEGLRQSRLDFPMPPPKISFASSSASSTQQVKDLLDAWHAETREEGPHRGDVEVFEKYLVRVVKEERNMAKASTLVKWLNVVIDQDPASHEKGKKAWQRCMEDVSNILQAAVRQRGLGALNI